MSSSRGPIAKLRRADLLAIRMTFTIGRGNDIVCAAVEKVAERLIGKKTAELFSDMGAAWNYLLADPQLRWIGPEKGVIHIATGAVVNALWDSELLACKARRGTSPKSSHSPYSVRSS